MVKNRTPSRGIATTEVPVVGMREPCPCGSGRRYKACHGRGSAHSGEALVRRPFEHLPGECDWIAMREIVPAATASLRLLPAYATGKDVTVATVLPMAYPALVRTDGALFVGLQTRTGSGDASRDIAAALLAALQAPDGTPVTYERPGDGPRLQDVVDLEAPFEVQVRDGFDFWLDGVELTTEAQESMERANAAVVPTQRLHGVEAAYWCRIGSKEHLRWVLPHDEEALLDAMARLRASRQDGLGPDTRLIGSFRAHGLLVPVWDLAPGSSAAQVEEPAQRWAERLAEAMTRSTPLTTKERQVRDGLSSRQLTIR